jgi:uncharacterized protein involved in exopolysaccharide biosynthesis
MDANRPVSYDLADYLSVLRRHWWVLVLLVALGVAGAAGVARTRPRVYEAATSVLVTPTAVQGGNQAGGRTSGAINLDTEAQLVVSTDIAVSAQKLLKVATPPDQLATGVSVTVPPNTTVLVITYAAPAPKEAQSGSHAFAIAYLQNRQATAQADLTAQISALDAKVKQYSATLSQLSSRLAGLKAADPTKADLNSQIATLTAQVNTLTSRENELSTAQVTPGKIINDAQLPSRPARPSVPLFLASGAMLGLLLGFGVALVRERTDKRLRRPVDVRRRNEVPLLGVFPRRVRPRLDDVYPPLDPAGRTFDRLRNEILASLTADDRVILVTGASRGYAATLVAANLAAALARGGTETALICAHLADRPPAHPLSRRPAHPALTVLTADSALPLAETVARLRDRKAFVVIEAPSTAASADAQSLAGHADTVILAVELRRTRHTEVVDAAEQLGRVGVPVLGAVVFPRLRKPVLPALAPAPAADETMVLARVPEERT